MSRLVADDMNVTAAGMREMNSEAVPQEAASESSYFCVMSLAIEV